VIVALQPRTGNLATMRPKASHGARLSRRTVSPLEATLSRNARISEEIYCRLQPSVRNDQNWFVEDAGFSLLVLGFSADILFAF
jgi:hypothetical protein